MERQQFDIEEIKKALEDYPVEVKMKFKLFGKIVFVIVNVE